MGKKSNIFLLSVLSGIAAGGFFVGNQLYNMAIKPKQHTDSDKDGSELVTQGRMWVRNHPEHRDIYIDAIDSLRLHAAYIPGSSEEHHYALVVHGTYDNSESMGIFAKEYHKRGWHILLPDLRGFGQSEGDYVGYGGDDRFDIIEWIYWIIKRDPQAKILLHGASMGAATVLMTTGEHLPENVICAVSDSSYTTVKEEFSDVYENIYNQHLPKWLAFPLLRFETKIRAGYDIFKIRPIEAVAKSATPTLFIHGDADDFIRPSMCRELFDAAKCQREFCMILGAKHIEGVSVDPTKYWNKVNEFLEHVKF